MEYLIGNITLDMREFQRQNGIKNNCVMNSQFLYNIMKRKRINDVKVKAVMVISCNEETNSFTFVGGHLIVLLGKDTIIDPSYDIFSLKNKCYCLDVKEMMENCGEIMQKCNEAKGTVKTSISLFLMMLKIEEKINKGDFGELLMNIEINKKQAEYIGKLHIL